MDKLLHRTSTVASGESLGGQFVPGKTIEKKSDAEEAKGTLLGDMFASAGKSISRPDDFEVDLNDLTKPAVWNKNDYGRTIKLTDD